MFIITATLMALLGQMSMTVPLESPSSDFKQFFDQRIVGGSAAGEGRAPHMVALVHGIHYKSLSCGGSIITPWHILTAGHCIMPFVNWNGQLQDSYHAVVATNTWNRGGIIAELEGHRIHPQYNPATIKNDGGILILRERLELNERVGLIGLDFDWVDGGVESFVTGWGTQRLWGPSADTLQILHVSTITPKQCELGVANMGGGPPMDPKLEICTFHSPGHGMCHGDSGSALVSKVSGKEIGIVSWGYPCAVGGPDMFTRVRSMKYLILSVIRHKSVHLDVGNNTEIFL